MITEEEFEEEVVTAEEAAVTKEPAAEMEYEEPAEEQVLEEADFVSDEV